MLRLSMPFSATYFVAAVLSGAFSLAAVPGSAQENPAHQIEIQPGYDADLGSLRWTNRPIVVFADSDADPRFQEQIDKLLSDQPALLDRDVVILVDTDPSQKSPLRQKLRPRGFMLVLIGKDGGIKLRKPSPWTVRELSRTIDKMPMRQREIDERRESNVEKSVNNRP